MQKKHTQNNRELTYWEIVILFCARLHYVGISWKNEIKYSNLEQRENGKKKQKKCQKFADVTQETQFSEASAHLQQQKWYL